MAAEWEEGQREADASLEEDGSDASYEYTTADSQQEQNSLTMGRGITTSASANNLLSKSSRGLMNPSSSSSLLLNPPTRQRSNPSILTENAIPIAPEEQPPPAPSGTPPRPPGPPAANAPGTASQQSNRAPEEGSAPGAVDAAAGVQASDGRARTPPKRVPITDPHDALITAEPEMLACTLSSEDEFVLLACDGLFDVFSSEEVRTLGRFAFCVLGSCRRFRSFSGNGSKGGGRRKTKNRVVLPLCVLPSCSVFGSGDYGCLVGWSRFFLSRWERFQGDRCSTDVWVVLCF